tara:strand:+ start:200 stop:1186 length:987 start_codon:yes stop_codon:yes gene_type:complete
MANLSGFPYCTPWKNYRYPVTLIADEHIEFTEKTGHFDQPDGYVSTPSVYLDADYALNYPDIAYKFIFEKTGTGAGTKYKCKGRHYPMAFYDGNAGTRGENISVDTVVPGWFALGSIDTVEYLTAVNSLSPGNILPYTDKFGNKRSLHPMGPGVYVSFPDSGFFPGPAISNNDTIAFKIKSTALDGVPKIIDGTYTSYFQQPVTGGDTVVTEPIPFSTNRSFYLSINHEPRTQWKRALVGANWGHTVWIEVSEDGENWMKKGSPFIDDFEFAQGTYPNQAGFGAAHDARNPSNALDAKKVRLKHEYVTGGSVQTLHPTQFIKQTITPY